MPSPGTHNEELPGTLQPQTARDLLHFTGARINKRCDGRMHRHGVPTCKGSCKTNRTKGPYPWWQLLLAPADKGVGGHRFSRGGAAGSSLHFDSENGR